MNGQATDTSDLAMVSRIRVEVRGGSMEAAERVAFLLLDHARMAGYLEGIMTQTSEYTDHHFHRPEVMGKYPQPIDPWSELGMLYAGRVSCVFDPGVEQGGLRQYSFVTLKQEISEPGDPGGSDGGWVPVDPSDGEQLVKLPLVTDEVMVLERRHPVTRDLPFSMMATEVEETASAEDVLDNIRRLVNVKDLKVETQNDPERPWAVVVEVLDEAAPGGFRYGNGFGLTLLEAALDAYGRCGEEVTHFDTTPGGTAGGIVDFKLTKSSGLSTGTTTKPPQS